MNTSSSEDCVVATSRTPIPCAFSPASSTADLIWALATGVRYSTGTASAAPRMPDSATVTMPGERR